MAGPVKPSAEMMLILKHHQSGEHDLDPKGLRDDKAMHFPTKEEGPDYEIYQVPYPRGVAGVNRFLGPGKVADLKP